MKPQDMTNEQLAAELLEPLPHGWAVKEAARRLQSKETTDMSEPATGWGLRVSQWWSQPFLTNQIFWTRAEAIRDYNSRYPKPDQYRRDRRAGKVLAVRVTLTEDATQNKETNKCQ